MNPNDRKKLLELLQAIPCLPPFAAQAIAREVAGSVDNLVAFVTDEISRVFDTPPKITSDSASAQALIEALTDDGMFALTLKTGEVYSKLTSLSALHPWWDAKKNRIKTTLLPSSVLWVVQRDEDPTEAETVIYQRILRDTVSSTPLVEYVRWDSDSVFLFDAVGAVKAPMDNPEMLNPYGIVPFAWLRDQLPIGAFFTEPDESLANAQDNLNVLLTAANQLTKYQGFSQPVLTGVKARANIFAFRATDPKVMMAATDPVGDRNDEAIREMILASGMVVLAWGNHGTHRNRSQEIHELLREILAIEYIPVRCFKMNKNGEPAHPLYQREDAELQVWVGGIGHG